MNSDLLAQGLTTPWIVMVLPGLSPPLMMFLYGTTCTERDHNLSKGTLHNIRQKEMCTAASMKTVRCSVQSGYCGLSP